MSIINKVKDHISNNRGKYGAAAGVGTAAGAAYLVNQNPALINQAGFNVLANGQNLAIDTADKIGYGREQLSNLGMENKIDKEYIDAGNALYNSKIGQMLNPNALDATRVAAHMTKTEAETKEALNDAYEKGQNLIDQGMGYVKKLNSFNENSIKIPLKSMLLEGYSPEQILESICNNHNSLNKNLNNLNNLKNTTL